MERSKGVKIAEGAFGTVAGVEHLGPRLVAR
jgi:hypothetical protein